MTICQAVSIQYRNVTDGRTDEQRNGSRDRIAISISRDSFLVLTRDNKVMLKVQALQGAAHIVSAVGAFIFLLYFT